jgi:integrase
VTTKRNYATLSKKHLEADPFGSIPLGRLRASDVDRLMLSMRDAGYADSTRQRVFNVLRTALSDAKRDGLIARNPMMDMHQPKVERKEAAFLSPADTRRVLEAAEGSRYHAVLSTIAALGLRKGEALALKWADVDLDAGTLRVRGTLSRIDQRLVVTEPKTAKSRRTLALSPGMVFLLSVHRDLQQIERERAGNQWTESGHVFTTELGGPLEPSNVLRALKTAAEGAGVTGATVHTLRHSAATTMLEAGVNLKAVSDLLGHADIRITADVYGHVSPELAREAMGTLSERIGL